MHPHSFYSNAGIGFASITINQDNVSGTIKARGGSSVGGAFGFIKGDPNITLTQKNVKVDIEADSKSYAGSAVGSTGTGVSSHGNDYSGGDRDDNGKDGGH